ncbi:MAG: helix-turn-helix domain-containing protein [Haloarculaceae archaeon]
MSFAPIALYTHTLGVTEAAGFLYLIYRKRLEFLRDPMLALPVLGLFLFVVVEIGVGHLPPLVVHIGHTVAAVLVALGLASLLVRWWSVRPATDPVPRDGERPDWMTDLDDEILRLLDASDIVLSPALISYNLGYSRESVNRHLRRLEDHGYVERVDRGKYELSAAGREHPYWGASTATSVTE